MVIPEFNLTGPCIVRPAKEIPLAKLNWSDVEFEIIVGLNTPPKADILPPTKFPPPVIVVVPV